MDDFLGNFIFTENLNIGKKGKINFVDFLLIITYVYKDGDDPMEDILNVRN